MTKEVPRTSVLRDEELNKTLIARLRSALTFKDLQLCPTAADRIESLATTNEQLVATNEALSISNATLIAERDEALEWLSASQGYIADAVYALDKQEAAEAKLAKAVKALNNAAIQLDWCQTAREISREIDATLAEIKGESQ